jgi:hypothetical protein
MSLRTTNIVVFLICINSAAILVGATPIADVGASPDIGGGAEIEDARDQGREIATDRSALDQFVNGLIAAASSVSVIFEVAIAGPSMFLNLGVPAPIVTFVAAPLYVVVGLDVLQVLSGRDLT